MDLDFNHALNVWSKFRVYSLVKRYDTGTIILGIITIYYIKSGTPRYVYLQGGLKCLPGAIVIKNVIFHLSKLF